MAKRGALPLKAKAPSQPPTSADFSALVKKVNQLATKAGVAPLSELVSGRIPAWKRWVGGEAEHDVTGLRDVVATNAVFTNELKGDVDALGQAMIEVRQDIRELQEAAPTTSFP
jgi:hypothetical protein